MSEPVIPTDPQPEFTLRFTKADADALFTCLDVTLKAAGLPAAQAVVLWASKVRDAITVVEEPLRPAP